MRRQLLFLIFFLMTFSNVFADDLWSNRGFRNNHCYHVRAVVNCRDCNHCDLNIFPRTNVRLTLPIQDPNKFCQEKVKDEALFFFQFFDKPQKSAKIFSIRKLSSKASEIMRFSEDSDNKSIGCGT